MSDVLLVVIRAPPVAIEGEWHKKCSPACQTDSWSRLERCCIRTSASLSIAHMPNIIGQHPDAERVIDKAFFEHYRCPDSFAHVIVTGRPSTESGYFRFGPHAIGHGRSSAGFRAPRATDDLYDMLQDVGSAGSVLRLPFHPSEVVANLRHERYVSGPNGNRQALAV